MKRLMLLCLSVALLVQPFVASGGQRIEWTYFPTPNLELESRWEFAQPRANMGVEALNAIVAQSPLTELRLSIPPAYVGKRVRIFMVLPAFNQGISNGQGFLVEWRTQGIYLSGKGRPGDRVLLFQGTANSNLLRDNLTYTFHIDGRYTSGPIRFEPIYEIEEQ